MRWCGLVVVAALGACGSSGNDDLRREVAASREAVRDLRSQVDALELEVKRATNINDCAAPPAPPPAVDGGVPFEMDVEVKTIPPGATVFGDGISFGQTPVTIHRTRPTMELRFEKPGYRTSSTMIDASTWSITWIIRPQR
jgi:hypothetical protein